MEGSGYSMQIGSYKQSEGEETERCAGNEIQVREDVEKC